MPQPPKFVQISGTANAGTGPGTIFALDASGSVWVYGTEEQSGLAGWAPLSDHRFTSVAN
jgi:hypothetical protein